MSERIFEGYWLGRFRRLGKRYLQEAATWSDSLKIPERLALSSNEGEIFLQFLAGYLALKGNADDRYSSKAWLNSPIINDMPLIGPLLRLRELRVGSVDFVGKKLQQFAEEQATEEEVGGPKLGMIRGGANIISTMITDGKDTDPILKWNRLDGAIETLIYQRLDLISEGE